MGLDQSIEVVGFWGGRCVVFRCLVGLAFFIYICVFSLCVGSGDSCNYFFFSYFSIPSSPLVLSFD